MLLLVFLTHRFRTLSVALISLMTIAYSVPACGKNISSNPPACVHVIAQFYEGINAQVTTVNVKSGQVSRDDRPTIPPNAWFSPDGKMAFFLQTVSANEIGMYIQSTSNGQPILLGTTTLNDLFAVFIRRDLAPWGWSPDSSHFAYISKAQDKLSLTLTDTIGTLRKTQTLSPPKTLGSEVFYGWSADSAYIATAITELNVWSGKDLVRIGPGTPMPTGRLEATKFVAWSPYGHRLAALLSNNPTKLTVWSPERGIEALTPVVLDNEYFWLYWSPYENGLQLVSSTGHTGFDEMFTLTGNVLSRVDIPDKWPVLIGWTKEGNAIVYLWHDVPTPELVTINTRTQRFAAVDIGDIFVENTSPDAQFIVIITRRDHTYRTEIARIDGTERILLLEETLPDGAEPQTLALYSAPSWSPNGNYVADEWLNIYRTRSQMVVGQLGSSAKQIVDGLLVGWIENDWLIYIDNGSWHLRLLKAESGKQFGLDKFDLTTSNNVWISVSPDKRTLVERSQQTNLFFTSLNESDPWAQSVDLGKDVTFYDLSQNPDAIIQMPQSIAWSPDSTMVAVVYSSSSTNNGMLNIFSREGKLLLQAPFRLDPIGGGMGQLSVVWASCEP
jgi:hypothetical protein